VITEISAASSEQSAGIEQVRLAIDQMDEVTQQNAALVEQATAATNSLADQTGQLQAAVSVPLRDFYRRIAARWSGNVARLNFLASYSIRDVRRIIAASIVVGIVLWWMRPRKNPCIDTMLLGNAMASENAETRRPSEPSFTVGPCAAK
jgi:hypothetical protein